MNRIAMLIPDLGAGGAERVMLSLAREFTRQGHQIDLLVFKADGPLLQHVPDKVRLVDLGARDFGLGQIGLAASAFIRLRRWVLEERADVLLSTVTGANLVALLVKVVTRSKISMVVREAQSVSNIGSKLKTLGMRCLYPRADAVIGVSRTVSTELVDMICLSPAIVHVIPNPVDAGFVRERATAALQHPWVHAPDGPLMIAVGRLVAEKDYPTLLLAFALLPRDINAKLIILGEGPERVRLERLVQELSIQDHVQLVGFDTNPWRWMTHARLYVISSRSEGNPNALLEALALGLPAVATSYDESIVSFATQWGIPLAPPGNAEILSRVIARQLISPVTHSGTETLPCVESSALQYLRVLGISGSRQ